MEKKSSSRPEWETSGGEASFNQPVRAASNCMKRSSCKKEEENEPWEAVTTGTSMHDYARRNGGQT